MRRPVSAPRITRPAARAAARPAPDRRPALWLAALATALTAALATGCGPGENQRNPDSDSAGVPGNPAGAERSEAAADSALSDARETRDSLKAAGVGPAAGLDSFANKAAVQAERDIRGQDTNRAMVNQRSSVGRDRRENP